MSVTPAPLDQLSVVLDADEMLIAALSGDQWDLPTPCAQWNVRELVSHLVDGNRSFAAILRGEEPSAGGVDQLGEEPSAAAYREAADLLLEALRRPGVMQETFTVPFGTVPGSVVVHLRLTEILVHGWDLARATGQDVTFPDEVVGEELEFTRRSIANVPPGRSPFGPPQPVPDDAPVLDQLAALLGRTVTRAEG